MLRFPTGPREFSSLQSVLIGVSVRPASCSACTGDLCPWVKRLWREVNHFNQVPRLRMSGALLSFSRMPSWPTHGEFYFTFIIIIIIIIIVLYSKSYSSSSFGF